MKKKIQIQLNTITFKLIVLSLLIIIPILCYALYNNYYSIHQIRKQMAYSYKSLVSVYLDEIDSKMCDINHFLNNFAVNIDGTDALMKSQNETEQTLHEVEYKNILQNEMNVYCAYLDAIFIKFENGDFITTNDLGTENNIVQTYIENTISKSKNQSDLLNGWHLYCINSQTYFIRVLKYNNWYTGAWVKSSKIMDLISQKNQVHSSVFTFISSSYVLSSPSSLVGQQQQLAKTIWQNKDDYIILDLDDKQLLVIDQQSTQGDFKLAMLIPNNAMLQDLTLLEPVGYVLLCFSIIMLLFYLYFLKRIVINPLRNLLSAIRKIGKGKLGAKLVPEIRTTEFEEINSSFNKMIQEISQLKISCYEEKLLKQSAQYKQLKLQINPHFLMNSLNIIYSLAQTQKTDLIKKMSLYLSRFYQYRLKNNLNSSDFVMLKDEAAHVQDYLDIQQMRYPQKLSWKIDIPPYLLESPVPQFIIQIFVENSIKHGMPEEGILNILIHADYSNNYLKIKISDSGCGFNEQILKKLNENAELTDETENHIGIRNVKQRIQILYDGQGKLEFSNRNPQGAKVMISLPLKL